MSLASQPDERADHALEVYLGHRGAGTLALALGPSPAAGTGSRVGAALQRTTSSVLRGGLTGWVHVGMTVRRLRGRADPLEDLGQGDTFAALARLVQATIEARPLPAEIAAGPAAAAHVRLFSTPVGAEEAVDRIQRVLRPYAAAGTITRTGPAVIAWFAIRHLIATRSHDYSLQVVHVAVEGVEGGHVSLMLPRDPAERAEPAGGPAGDPAGDVAVDPAGLQAYLDAYREHLTRELLLEPVVSTGPVTEFAWTPEPTGDGGVAVGGTIPGTVSDEVVLRMAEHAVAQLGERSPESAGRHLGGPERDGDLLVQRWAVGDDAGCDDGGRDRARYVLSVAARTGGRRRPTQVLIHFAAAARVPALPPPPHEPPRSGPDADEARGLALLPLWWHSAEARCDGNDVILYEMPFRGRRLRVRANDYPAEPMYTLLVGDPAAEIAAVDLEHWPSCWVRPRSF